MKQKKDAVSVFLVAITILMAAIALFVLFGNAFQDEARFSGFYAIFGDATNNREPVPGLIAGFVLYLVAIILPLTSGIFDKKGKLFVFGLETLVLVGAGVLFLFSVQLYSAANHISYSADLTLGTGTICSLVFAFIGAAFSAIAFLRSKKA